MSFPVGESGKSIEVMVSRMARIVSRVSIVCRFRSLHNESLLCLTCRFLSLHDGYLELGVSSSPVIVSDESFPISVIRFRVMTSLMTLI